LKTCEREENESHSYVSVKIRGSEGGPQSAITMLIIGIGGLGNWGRKEKGTEEKRRTTVLCWSEQLSYAVPPPKRREVLKGGRN